jgi:REP element-mobilizing transposase RayT
MILNEYGQIAEQQWHWLGKQYPYVVLHEFVVMPNHIHGIIEINRSIVGTGRDLSDNEYNVTNGIGRDDAGIGRDDAGTGRDDAGTGRDDVGTGRDDAGIGRDDAGTGRDDVGTGHDLSLRIKSLSELMGAYKTTTSKKIHLLGLVAFAWQRSFHDHIIRDEKSFDTISNYIANNPSQWERDKFYHQ